ncbi:COG1361 family protein [Hamadaea tsunoensis]|uniref:hypothetical protein n=1 Tax=Hamadaea tsunoensis TaxID=53368 RepID=UPI00042A202E|nr:hypothetical protein [Hamadaea tsunoensis]
MTRTLALVTALLLLAGCDPRATPAPSPTPVAVFPTILPTSTPNGADLRVFGGAVVDVPDFGSDKCAHGPMRIWLGQHNPGGGQQLLAITAYQTADVDHDGTPDYVTLLACGSGARQLVAFHRDHSDLHTEFNPIGRIIGGVPFDDFRVRPDGRIAVLVSSHWRIYSWSHGAFTAVSDPGGGPAAKLVVGSADLTMQPDRGVLTFTVGNLGTLGVPAAEVSINLPEGVSAAGPAWSGCATAAEVVQCPVGALGAGGSRTFTFDVVSDSPLATETLIVDAVRVYQLPPYVAEEGSGGAADLQVIAG